MGVKVVFLDRDGTINVDHGFVYKIEDWVFIEKASEALQILQKAGYKLAIITNQSGIAHGKYALEDMQALHDYMKQELAKADIKIDAVAFCPHGRDQDECDCRKPKSGLTKYVEAALGPIDYATSWTVGDKEADVGFGKNAGTKTALVRSGYWNKEELKTQPDMFVDSLYDFAVQITHAV